MDKVNAICWKDGARPMLSLHSLLERVWTSGGVCLASGFEVGVAEPIA